MPPLLKDHCICVFVCVCANVSSFLLHTRLSLPGASHADTPPPESLGFLNRHADPAGFQPRGRRVSDVQHLQNPHAEGPDASELAAAKALADNAAAFKIAHEQRKADMAVVTECPLIHEDVALPESWTHADWTGLPPDQLATATPMQKREASIKRYAFNAMKSAEIPLRRPLKDYRSEQCKSQVRLWSVCFQRKCVVRTQASVPCQVCRACVSRRVVHMIWSYSIDVRWCDCIFYLFF